MFLFLKEGILLSHNYGHTITSIIFFVDRFYSYECLLFKLLYIYIFTYGRFNGILTYLKLHKYSVYNKVLSYT